MDYSEVDALALIDMKKVVCPHLVILQTRVDGWFDRFQGFQIHMDKQIPQLVRGEGFVSHTVQLCGSVNLIGSVANQLLYLQCETIVCGRYLGVQFGRSGAAIARIGVFGYPDEFMNL